MTDKALVKDLNKLSTGFTEKQPVSQRTKYKLGDHVVALWSGDGRWRNGVIQHIVEDEAVIICPEECSVRPTRVKVASLMPDVNKIADGANRSDHCVSSSSMELAKTGLDNKTEEVFCHKDVEAFMAKNSLIFQNNGDVKETSKILSRATLSDISSPPSPIHSETIGRESNQHRPAGINENVVASFIDSQANSSTSCGNLATNSSTDSGNLATMARTGRGSRYLQSLLVTTPASVPQIYGEIMSDAVSAMTHPKACFVVQKLLEVAIPVAVNHMVQVIVDNFIFLSLNPYGCHVVQKALTVASNPLMMVIQLENYRNLMSMLHSAHGTYVAQACLPLLPPRTTMFIINAVRGQVLDLGRNQHGTYFLQKMVAVGTFHGGEGTDGTNGNVIVEEILKQVGSLAHNQHGTWLVQSVLKCGDATVKRLAEWVLCNLLGIYKSQPAMFLALALVQKLRERCKVSQSWAAVLGDLVIAMVDHQVAGRPLLVAAALHPTGHLLAREVARQVTYLGHGKARDRVVEVVTRYKDILGSNSYGNLVLKGLHEASGSYNMAAQN